MSHVPPVFVTAFAAALALSPTASAGTITMDTGVAGLDAVPVEAFRVASEDNLAGGLSNPFTNAPLTLTRIPDALSTPLLAQAFTQATLPTVVLTVVEDSGQQSTWTFQDVRIDTVTQTDTANARTRESLSMTWDAMNVVVTP
jgi:type VI protein secretion system component Hcp